jgi:hypothetical protein
LNKSVSNYLSNSALLFLSALLQSDLADLLTQEQQQQLAVWLNGLMTPDPQTELLKLFTPANLKKILAGGYAIRREWNGQGIISLEFDGGVCRKVKVTHSID